MTRSSPPGAQVLEPTDQGHLQKPAHGPFGPDFTQSMSRVDGAAPEGRPDTAMLEIQRMAALGRAKGLLLMAQGLPDAQREGLIDALLLRMIDFALYGADIETILNGLR